MKRSLLCLGVTAFTLGAAACQTVEDPKKSRNLAAYLTSDTCAAFSEAGACEAAPEGACSWVAIEADCPSGADCPTGACVVVDPCNAHASAATCLADQPNGCQWAAMDRLCPAGANCPEEGNGGFCYGVTDDCVCACPLYCPEGETCPPCDCDCTGGGGGTCTCACPDCAPGERCPPCDCSCTDDGCVQDGTCVCACPDCPPDAEDCGPCECTCSGSSGGSAGTGTAVCACPDCEPDMECPPCECEVGDWPEDPCLAYVTEANCLADLENACSWIETFIYCEPDAPDCRSGLCQGFFIGDDCGCVCPSCLPDEACPPCVCDCGGGDPDCVPGGWDEPTEPPAEPGYR